MRIARFVRAHRVLTAFAAGVLLTLVALAAVGYYVLSDQRRSARVLAAGLSQALSREVRIDRVTDMSTERIVMRGVRLPREGGWPAEVAAEQVEATGPLLAAARGDPAPLRLIVTRPVVEVPATGARTGLAALETLREGLAGFLGGPTILDVSLAGGTARHTDGAMTFDLVLRKARGEGRVELTLRDTRATPLVVTIEARMDGETARLGLAGRGGLAPLAPWLPAGRAAAAGDRALDLHLDVELASAQSLTARGNLRVGDALAADLAATLQDGVLEVALPRALADLAFAATAAGAAWQPTGRAELADVTVRWRPDAGVWPSARATVHVAALALPAAAVGTDVAAEGLAGRLVLEPAAGGLALFGEARADRLRVAGVEAAPAEARYRVALDGRGGVGRADLTGLSAEIDGASLQGSLGYDAVTRQLDARLGGEAVEAASLVRRLAPGWLAVADRLLVQGLRLTATGLDLRDLRAGTARLEARGLRLRRAAGDVSGGRTLLRAELARNGVTLALDMDGVAGTLPAFQGQIPALAASAELVRSEAGGLEPQRATLTARDRQGRELVGAGLRPATAAGRLVLSARAPALERLDGFWPTVSRRVNGSASLDVELLGPSFGAAEGRLTLAVSEAELLGGKVWARDLAAAVPIRRGIEGPAPPPWGKVEVGELIAYGLVVRDLASPARMVNDRLSLNDLAYALYAGEGKGWTEIELAPSGLSARGKLTGERVRVEEFVSAYGIRGGTMTGLLRYDVDFQYRAGRLGVSGRFQVPDGGTVNIELLNRLFAYAESDPTGVVRSALRNLRAFDYKSAEIEVHSAGDDNILVNLRMQGRERFLIFPPKVREINIRNMPVSFLARQFPGS